MTFSWRIARNTMAVLGVVGAFMGVSMSDTYTNMGLADPAHVQITMILGVLMMLPFICYKIKEEFCQ